MDNLASGSIGGVSVLAILGFVYGIYKAINHRRIRSTCCGAKMEASLDVEETTPLTTLLISVPKVDESRSVNPLPNDAPQLPYRYADGYVYN
jgi:hypothetical protein